MSRLKVKLLLDHSPTCRVQDPPCYFLPTEAGGSYAAETVYLDAIGRKGGSRRWAKAICNDPKCDCVVLVRVDTIEDLIREALTSAKSR